jgi:hypothetical protein
MPEETPRASYIVARVRRQDELAFRARPGADPLRETLAVSFHEAHGALHDGAWATVVGHEIDPAQAREGRRKVEHAPDVGKPPGVDRLIVVAHEEDVPAVAGQGKSELELASIDVLDLVDEQGPAPVLPDVAEL